MKRRVSKVEKSRKKAQRVRRPPGPAPARAPRHAGGRPKGTRKTGGRRAGTPNKRAVELRAALEAAGMGSVHDHPVLWMFKVYTGQVLFPAVVTEGRGKDKTTAVIEIPASAEVRKGCAAEVAAYLEPKRRPVDAQGDDSDKLVIKMLNLAELEPSGIGVKVNIGSLGGGRS